MTEPDVALTDFAVAIECAAFAILLFRRPAGRSETRLRAWFILFFVSVGVASLAGGIVHGFFLDQASVGNSLFWLVTLLAMGITAFSMWAISSELLFSPRVVQAVVIAAGVQFAVYAFVVLALSSKFLVGIANSLPSLLLLLAALTIAYRRTGQSRILVAAAGPALVVIAAVLQQLKLGIHPTYFNHNALYHVLQGTALLLLFQGAVHLLDTRERDQDTDFHTDPSIERSQELIGRPEP